MNSFRDSLSQRIRRNQGEEKKVGRTKITKRRRKEKKRKMKNNKKQTESARKSRKKVLQNTSFLLTAFHSVSLYLPYCFGSSGGWHTSPLGRHRPPSHKHLQCVSFQWAPTTIVVISYTEYYVYYFASAFLTFPSFPQRIFCSYSCFIHILFRIPIPGFFFSPFPKSLKTFTVKALIVGFF